MPALKVFTCEECGDEVNFVVEEKPKVVVCECGQEYVNSEPEQS